MSSPSRGPGRGSPGFTLLEMIIALTLSAAVLMGIVGILSQMMRSQTEGIRRGTITGWSLSSLSRMLKEIEDAGVLAWPTGTAGGQDMLVACSNWSRLAAPSPGGRIDDTAPAVVFYYCYDEANSLLRRYANIGDGVVCPAAPLTLPACNGAGGWTENDVVAAKVFRDGGAAIFERADDAGGVRVRYRVGDPNPSAAIPVPISAVTDVKITMNKQYYNTVD